MKSPILLNQESLTALDNSFTKPSYDRSDLVPGIVHIGVGGFHRSHEAYYTDMLLEKTGSKNWGICGVGLREGDRKIADVLKKQDYLYTLMVKHPNGSCESRVIGSIIDFLLAGDDPQAVIDRMAAETTKIVSLTITEGGYNFDDVTGSFDFTDADVQHDLKNPQSPKTVFGYLTESLRKRRAAGLPAYTVQSCDNIQHNGNMTRNMLLAFAGEQDPELAEWIQAEVCFPNAMVDRITPVTTAEDIKLLEEQTGIVDEWPVTCEPFCQWVVEDTFSNSRPEWELVGAQFVNDVTPYETMKIRLLNAGHSVLGMLGSLRGHKLIEDCVNDPLFEAYLRRFMNEEVTPVLSPVEGVDLTEYKNCLIERFANPNIKDSLVRICLESSSKLPKFIVPTIKENLSQGGSISFSALTIAAWCYYSDKGVSQDGSKLEIIDSMKDELHAAASGTENDVSAFLQVKAVFGDLAQSDEFMNVYTPLVSALYEDTDISALMNQVLTLSNFPPKSPS